MKNVIKQTCQTTIYFFFYFLQTLSLCSQSWGYGKMGKPTQTHTHSLLRWKTWQLFATGVHVEVCVFSYTWILFWSRVEAVYTPTRTPQGNTPLWSKQLLLLHTHGERRRGGGECSRTLRSFPKVRTRARKHNPARWKTGVKIREKHFSKACANEKVCYRRKKQSSCDTRGGGAVALLKVWSFCSLQEKVERAQKSGQQLERAWRGKSWCAGDATTKRSFVFLFSDEMY